MKRWFLHAAIVLWTARSASAQTAAGAIQETISDQSGGVIIGARVALTELQTNQKRSDATDANGFFQFRALSAGSYHLEVEQNRFARRTFTIFHCRWRNSAP